MNSLWKKLTDFGAYSLEEIEDEETWDKLVLEYGRLAPNQLWYFGAMSERVLSCPVKRFLVTSDGKPALLAQAVKIRMINGYSFLNVYDGPIMVNNDCDSLKFFLKKIKQSDFTKSASFLKIEPFRERDGIIEKILFGSGFYKSQNYLGLLGESHAALDLRREIDFIWRSMNQTTRRHIRFANRKGLSIRRARTDEDFEIFWKLLQEMTARKKLFAVSRHKLWFKEIYLSPSISSVKLLPPELFLADYKGETVAAAFMLYFEDTAVFYVGGSLIRSEVGGLKPLLWHIIQEAKNRGFNQFALGKIDSEKTPGMALFYRGFGCGEIPLIGTYDYNLQ
ncbi:MAG TPA: GNAT family N-acetyltransferase [Candidatus Paceibacterota bacterium]